MGKDGDVAGDLERARQKLMTQARRGVRAVAEAKIGLLRRQRDEAVHKAQAKISQEYAAKGSFNSGARLKTCWVVAVEEADKTTSALIGELLPLGVDEDTITGYLVADVRLFLRSTMTGLVLQQQVGSPGAAQRMVSSFDAQADAHASGIRDLVRSRGHDFVQEEGTRLERRLKWLGRRPAVTIGAFIWVAITSLYGHVEMFRKLAALLARQ
jgi:hypothetical protein